MLLCSTWLYNYFDNKMKTAVPEVATKRPQECVWLSQVVTLMGQLVPSSGQTLFSANIMI